MELRRAKQWRLSDGNIHTMTMTYNREGLKKFGALSFEPKVSSTIRRKLNEVEDTIIKKVAKDDCKCE
jgi:hypothetical protein